MNPNFIAGRAAVDVLKNMKAIPDNHYEIHSRVAEELSDAGFEVQKFLDVKYWKDTQNGRIDVVAARAGGLVAIELNNRRLKPRSVPKLLNVNAYRIIVTRQIGLTGLPKGVDENVVLRVTF